MKLENLPLSPDDDAHPFTDAENTALWSSLGLHAAALDSGQLPPHLTPEKLAKSLQQPSSDTQDRAWNDAVDASLKAYAAENPVLHKLLEFQAVQLPVLDAAECALADIASRLETVESAVTSLQTRATQFSATSSASATTHAHLSAFVNELILEPYLIRHIVDGKIGDVEYEQCLSTLSKKVALFEMQDTRQTAAFQELNSYLNSLVDTAVVKVRNYLIDKIALLKRPNTNVNIVKENVLLKHRPLVEFIEQHAPDVFRQIKSSYVDTMSRTYFVLFKKYTAGLLAMKQQLPSERADTLVGSLTDSAEAKSGSSLKGFFGTDTSASTNSKRYTASAAGAGVGQFALGSRLDVLKDVEGPAIVLAVAWENKETFYYEQIHRSLGKMLSETCASEHLFCKHFFGESNGRMFNSFFQRIVGILLDAVAAHTAPTRDAIGVLLALKVNEAQRSSMQKRNILDLSDFFIKVDIQLKPKFKKLLDENVTSMAEASKIISKTAPRSSGDTSPHIITRRFAEFSASMLAIARFGTPDDSILEGIRRLRTEYNGFLNAISTLFTRPKLRYMFLINNIDLVLSMFGRHNVIGTEDHKFFAELQEVHTAAYVEHEVADHFPDVVSFVRQFERTSKTSGTAKRSYPSEDRVSAVLRQFSSNWRLGVQHMQDNVLREFPNFELGSDLLRALFARLFAYHKRCESAIETQYPRLKVELVTSTEIVYELRQRTQQFST